MFLKKMQEIREIFSANVFWTTSDHLKMLQCFHDGHFLVRRAFRHTGIFGFGQVVIGPHVQPALMFDLRDVKIS